MRTFTAILIATFIGIVSAAVTINFKNNPYEIERNKFCLKKEELTEKDIDQAVIDFNGNITGEKHYKSKCLQACMFETTKQMSSDGTIDVVGFKYQAAIALGIAAENHYVIAVAIAAQCAQESTEFSTDRCERAWHYRVCRLVKWTKAQLFKTSKKDKNE